MAQPTSDIGCRDINDASEAVPSVRYGSRQLCILVEVHRQAVRQRPSAPAGWQVTWSGAAPHAACTSQQKLKLRAYGWRSTDAPIHLTFFLGETVLQWQLELAATLAWVAAS